MLIEHYNESLAAVAVLFLMLPCSAASTSETNSASATAPVASPPNIPPVAGLQAAVAPLLPQAVPLSCVQSLLDLARHSACRDAAQAIEAENISAALAALDALTAGAFHWRGAVTNGYQQGFFVNALRGYCLERMGDIVKAYRSYQNSRAYFDDTAVAMQCPEPRLEVFLGLGRTCLVAGRYTDAFNWLDLVRLEASATPRIATAADRALIRRAVEIGDYHDAITNFWDLQHLLLETGNLKLASGAAAQEAHSPTITDSAAQPPAPPASYKAQVSSISTLTRDEYRELAQLYFWTGRDSDGFDTLAAGLVFFGPVESKELDRGFLSIYLEFLPRATPAQCATFYTLLGTCIDRARALSGDENYLARLICMRNEMRRMFPELPAEDDLAKLRMRVERVASSIGERCPTKAPREVSHKVEQCCRNTLMQPSAHALNDTPTLIEDTLMNADIWFKRSCYRQAIQLAEKVEALQTNSLPIVQPYDRSTVCSVLSTIRAFTSFSSNVASETHGTALGRPQITPDGSFRAWMAMFRHAIWQSHGKGIEQVQPIDGLAALPHASPVVRDYLRLVLVAAARRGDLVLARDVYDSLMLRVKSADAVFASLIGAYVTKGTYAEAACMVRDALQLAETEGAKKLFSEIALKTWGWADYSTREDLFRLMSIAAFCLYEVDKAATAKARHVMSNIVDVDRQARQALADQQYETVLQLLTMDFSQPSHWAYRAAALYALGRTNDALHAANRASNEVVNIIHLCQ